MVVHTNRAATREPPAPAGALPTDWKALSAEGLVRQCPREDDGSMWGRRQRGEDSSALKFTPNELVAMQHLKEYLDSRAEQKPFFAGVSEVIFAQDREAVLSAVERFPELLTDQGDTG